MKKLWQILLMIIGGVPGTWYETFVPGTLIYLPLGGGSNGEPNRFSSCAETELQSARVAAMRQAAVRSGFGAEPDERRREEILFIRD